MDIIAPCPLKRPCEEKVHCSLQPYYRTNLVLSNRFTLNDFFCFFGTPSQKKKSKKFTKEELYTKKEFHMYLLCKSLVIVILEYPFLRYCTIIHVPYRSLNNNLVYSPNQLFPLSKNSLLELQCLVSDFDT